MIFGIGRESRKQLIQVLQVSEGAISIPTVTQVLGISNRKASFLLSRWAKQGWLRRIRKGWYLPVPLNSDTSEIPIEDPWSIAMQAFSPCYIGGCTAAQHWDFTEQIFHSTFVFTRRHFESSHQKFGEEIYVVKETSAEKFFGTVPVWRGATKILLSDPTKTIIDLLNTPALGGGIRQVEEILFHYVHSHHFDPEKLLTYGEQMGNKTIFKRLGFLLEKIKPDLYDLISQCRQRISKGYSKLDPDLEGKFFNSHWKLKYS